MSQQNKFWMWTAKAKADLTDLAAGTGKLYKAISAQTGTLAATGKQAAGLLQYAGNSGDQISLGWLGLQKAVFGIAVASADILLTVTTGYITIAGSGDYVIGRNLEAVTSGSVGFGMFNFASPAYFNPTENSSGS